MSQDIVEEVIPAPDYNLTPPDKISSARKKDGILYIPGEGAINADVMFIATSVLPEECASERKTNGGTRTYKTRPRYLAGGTGGIFKTLIEGVGFELYEDCYYTAMCKWLLPKSHRSKPKAEEVAWAMPALESEINQIKPKIIVCLGKPVFDALTDIKLSKSDAQNAWFYSEKYRCHVYLMDELTKPLYKPYFIENFKVDIVQVRNKLSEIDGISIDHIDLNYKVIDGVDPLRDWTQQMQEEGYTVFSVDCEWGGMNHVDGELRSVQFSWKPGHAIYLRFMDDQGNYAFEGGTYSDVGKILSPLLDRPDVKYVGHHIAADLPWLHCCLGLNWHEKTLLDTEFAFQCLDEEAKLGLEQMALRYTDLGKYDLDLIMWKKANKQNEEDGYKYIPDSILIPYAMKDVDVVIRSYSKIMYELLQQGLSSYYVDFFNPFVTDVFVAFTLVGLPMDQDLMDELRDLYSFCRDHLNKDLQAAVHKEATELLVEKTQCADAIESYLAGGQSKDDLWAVIKDSNPADTHEEILPFFDHFIDSLEFNIRSSNQMRRWLFDVKKFAPIKTTSNREKGLPAIPWETAVEKGYVEKGLYNPSIDKQSLQILSEKNSYPLLNQLLRLNAVGNICKAFLKEADVDEDGNVERENGLHFFLCSDGRVHGQLSTTETGRPRAWKPNILNWPKYVGDMIREGIHGILMDLANKGELPERFTKYADPDSEIPSLRSCVKAPEGWCFVESDYKTAEIRGLAFISGDRDLIDIMTKPDTQFGIHKETGKSLRLNYSEKSGILESEQDLEIITDSSSDLLLRDEEGNIQHPAADLHWSLAEMMYGLPREKMDKDIHRAAAKVGNFSSMYGASETYLERKIEQDTNQEPEEGTGKRILEALAKRQPLATRFLESMSKAPDEVGYLVAASGRKRHFATHKAKNIYFTDKREKDKLNAGLGREARNFFMQESVAATSARASKWLLDHYIQHNMQARPMVVLYDSIVTLCPLEERFEVEALHYKFMETLNTWVYNGEVMNYPIDNEFVIRWSTKPTEEEKELLYTK